MTIIEKDSFVAVGLKVEAAWQGLHTEMPKAWEIFKNRLKEVSSRKNDEMMDISLQKKGDIYIQIIGVEVDDPAEVADDMTAVTIPKQQYIRHVHKGDLASIATSFGKMYIWAEKNGIKAEEFKLDVGYRVDNSEKEHELYIKVSS